MSKDIPKLSWPFFGKLISMFCQELVRTLRRKHVVSWGSTGQGFIENTNPQNIFFEHFGVAISKNNYKKPTA